MDGEETSDFLTAERKVEIRVRKNGRKDKVIVEKSAAEGLPQGWIKKLVITNKRGRRNRRDPFFIDPKSEYIFHSFKDASRYVETGIIGNYARKLTESNIENDDSGNGKTDLLMESAGKRSADDLLEKETKINTHVRNSKQGNLSSSDEHFENCKMDSDMSGETSQVLAEFGKKDEAKDPNGKQHIARRITRSQAKANEEDWNLKIKTLPSSNAKTEKHNVKSRLSNASSQGPEKKIGMKEEEAQDSSKKRITRNKAKVTKNELSNRVTRRASKRLAGIELEQTPELNTRTKLRRVVSPDDITAGKNNQRANPVATGVVRKTDVPLKEVAKSYNEHSSPKPIAGVTSNNCVRAEMEVQIENIAKAVGRNGSGDKRKMKTPLVISEVEVNPVFQLEGYKKKEEMSPVSPLSSQTPATKREKTAAGKRLGLSIPKPNKVTSRKTPSRSSNKGEHSHPSGYGNAIQKRNELSDDVFKSSVVRGACSDMMEKNTNSFSSAFDTTLADIWKDPCIAFAIKTLTGESLNLPSTAAISPDLNNNHAKQKGVSFFPEAPGNVNKGYAKPASSSEAGADIWKDPCIDFAIKTLTGTIPVGLDEPGSNHPKSATQEQEGRQSSFDYVAQQCSKVEKKKKTIEKSGDARFPQSLSKDFF